MSALIGFLLAMLAQLMVLPTSWQQQHEATMTTTEITTAQQQQQLLSAAQAWISQNLSTVQATATAGTPMVIPVTTLAAANVGLPASFSPTNPFGQTWQVQALQPTAGTLQILVTAVNGTALTDLQAAGIAANVGQAGGFIPQNDSGVYPLGAARAYGNQANWNIPTAGYAGVTGGHPAALLVMTNGQVQSNALYRVAVPGQPQLNQMQTAIDMNLNNVNNAATVNAQQIVVANSTGAESVQLGSGSVVHYDGFNQVYSQADNGTVISNHNASAFAPLYAATVTANGDVQATGNISASNGTVTAARVHSTGNSQTDGNTQVNGTVVAGNRLYANEYVQINGLATQGVGCSPNGLLGNSGNGLLFCNGVWQPVGSGLTISGVYDVAQSSSPDLGWHKLCFVTGASGYPQGGINHVWPAAGPNANGQYDWQATSQIWNGNADVDFWVTCMS